MTDLPDGIDWDLYGWMTASKYRVTVLRELSTPKTPTAIADATPLQISHVSRALSELQERDLVGLLVDEERRKGRVYGRTARGDKMVRAITEMGSDE